MSGFDTRWLDLREPADHAARVPALLERAAAYLGKRERPVIVDLGCGTGSTVRALAPRLAGPAQWRLVDHDPALLEAARTRCGTDGFAFREGDLRDLDALPFDGADLVTASALFDLVSAQWVADFARRLREAGVGLYAALSYDGSIAWDVADPMDDAVTAAFNAHQRTDKGFGRALGPAAGAALAEALCREGFATERAESPWRLEEGPLLSLFTEGVAKAAEESGLLVGGELDRWRKVRLAPGAGGCRVGHCDILALPSGQAVVS